MFVLIAVVIISSLTCLALICSVLFYPKIKFFRYSISSYLPVCIVGALLIFAFGGLSFTDFFKGLTAKGGINPLKILILFLSMTFLSVFLDEEGFFSYLASTASKRAKSNQTALFFILYGVVSILTVFTSNDVIILTFTPFICYFAKHTDVNPVPYLVAEFAGANTWSMMLIIGNPTNVYLASYSNINFAEYLSVMALPTILAGVVQIFVLYLVFRKQLKKPINCDNERLIVKDVPSLLIGLSHLGVCLVLLVISSYVELEMWLICAVCAISLLLFVMGRFTIGHRPIKPIINTIKRLPYELVPFVLSMFVLVLALNGNGATTYLGEFISNGNLIFNFGTFGYLFSNLINNIPMSVLFSTFAPAYANGAVFATIIGSNVGAFLTPVGALAGIMFTDLVKKQNVNFGFKDFVKYGVIVSLPTLLSALLGLSLVI